MATTSRTISFPIPALDAAAEAAEAEGETVSGYVSTALIQRLRSEGRWDDGPPQVAELIAEARAAGVDVTAVLRDAVKGGGG